MQPRVSLSISDFDVIRRIGDGSYSTVILASMKSTGVQYAIKIINKHLIMRNKVVEYIKGERRILDCIDYDGVTKLHFTFQDEQSLYMGMELCSGGELFHQIEERGSLPLTSARFYCAEVILTLEYLRTKQVVHRDLKPENLLLSTSGHLKLIDFGSAKLLSVPGPPPPPPSPPMAALLAALQPAAPIPVPPHTDTADTDPASSSRSATASTSVPCSGAASQPSHPVASASSPPSASDPVTASAAAASDPDPGPDPAGPSGAQGLHSASAEPAPTPSLGVRPQRATSFVGTAEYVSPEVLSNTPLSYPADLWALGCLLFQMLVGKSPFRAASEYLTFQRVSDREFTFPEGMDPDARDLVDRLLVLEPSDRIGAVDMAELKGHPFFEGLVWEGLRSSEAPAFTPPPADTMDMEGLDWELNSLLAQQPLVYE
ncbi:MAG: hypothetical protein WDW38_003738 [Sanguina aurantia]